MKGWLHKLAHRLHRQWGTIESRRLDEESFEIFFRCSTCKVETGHQTIRYDEAMRAAEPHR
jgi:hypothetical protein